MEVCWADVDPLEPCFVHLTFVVPLRGRLRLHSSATAAESFLVGLGPHTLSSALTEGFVHCSILEEADEGLHVSAKHSLEHLFMRLFTLIELCARLRLKNSAASAGRSAPERPFVFSSTTTEAKIHSLKSG